MRARLLTLEEFSRLVPAPSSDAAHAQEVAALKEERDRNIVNMAYTEALEKITEQQAATNARLVKALGAAKDALFHAWQGFEAICDTDTSIDRRKMRDGALTGMTAVSAALAEARKGQG